MADDPIRRYSQSTEELDKASQKVQQIQMAISEVATILVRNPFDLMVSNVNVGFPAELAMNPNQRSLDGNKWPSAKQIAEALSELHDKRGKAAEAWRTLSDADRKLVSQHPLVKQR